MTPSLSPREPRPGRREGPWRVGAQSIAGPTGAGGSRSRPPWRRPLPSTGALAPLGLTVVDGDVVSGDPFATAYQPIVRAVLSTVRAGSVVIMHVTEANAQYTDEALPLILAGLEEKGLVPATLSEVLGPPPADTGRCARTGVLAVDPAAYRRA